MARIVPMDYRTIQQNRRGFVAAPTTDVGKTVGDIGGVVNLAEHFVNPLVGAIARGMYNPQDVEAAYRAKYPDMPVPATSTPPTGGNAGAASSLLDKLKKDAYPEGVPTYVRPPGPAEAPAPQMSPAAIAANANKTVPFYIQPTNEPWFYEPTTTPAGTASIAASLANPGAIPDVGRNVLPRIDLSTPAGLQFQEPVSEQTHLPNVKNQLERPGSIARREDWLPAVQDSMAGAFMGGEFAPAHKPTEDMAIINAGMRPAVAPAAEPQVFSKEQSQQVFKPAAPAQAAFPAGYIPTTLNEAKAMILEGQRSGNEEMIQRAMRAFQVGNGLDVVPETWQEALTGAHKRRAFNELAQLAQPHGKTLSPLEQELMMARIWNTSQQARQREADNPQEAATAQAKLDKLLAEQTVKQEEAANAPKYQRGRALQSAGKGASAVAAGAVAEEREQARLTQEQIKAKHADAVAQANLAYKKAQTDLAKVHGKTSMLMAQAALSKAASYKRYVDKYQPFTGTDRAIGIWRTEQDRLEAELRKHKAEKAAHEAVLSGRVTEQDANTLGYKDLGALNKNLAEAKLKAKGELAKANQGIADTQAAIDGHNDAGVALGIIRVVKPAAPTTSTPSDQPPLPGE